MVPALELIDYVATQVLPLFVAGPHEAELFELAYLSLELDALDIDDVAFVVGHYELKSALLHIEIVEPVCYLKPA